MMFESAKLMSTVARSAALQRLLAEPVLPSIMSVDEVVGLPVGPLGAFTSTFVAAKQLLSLVLSGPIDYSQREARNLLAQQLRDDKYWESLFSLGLLLFNREVRTFVVVKTQKTHA